MSANADGEDRFIIPYVDLLYIPDAALDDYNSQGLDDRANKAG